MRARTRCGSAKTSRAPPRAGPGARRRCSSTASATRARSSTTRSSRRWPAPRSPRFPEPEQAMASPRKADAARAAAREIGRLTVLRLIAYYAVAGVLLLCLSALLPQQPVGPAPSQPPTDMSGAIEWFRGQVAVFPTGAPVWVDALLQMIAAFLLVLPLAFVYVRTRTRHKFDHSLVQTVIVLPIVVTAILVVVRDSLALAFSLAGIVAAVRFRNTLKESGDAVYIFGSIGIGFASGIHAISVAAVLSIVFVVVELALWKFDFSAEFERTFARLCLPSGADLGDVPGFRSEPQREPAGNGAGR